MALQTNLVDVVYNSPYYAVVTQWNTRAFLPTFPSLTWEEPFSSTRGCHEHAAPLQEVLKRICGRYARLMGKEPARTKWSHQPDLHEGVKRITPGAQQVEEFKKMSDETMASLDQKVLSPATLKNVKGILAEDRKTRKP